MSKTILMGEGKLTDEERENLKNVTAKEEQDMKDLSARELQKEADKKKVTLEELLSTTLRPTEDRIIVWRDPVATVTEGGIIKPEQVIERERPSKGTVIAVGPGKDNENLTQEILVAILHRTPGSNSVPNFESRIKTSTSDYKPGDRIIFGRFAGTPIDDPETGEELLIMRPMDIFCKL